MCFQAKMKRILKNFTRVSIPTLIILFTLLEIGIRIFKPHLDLYKVTGRYKDNNPMLEWAKPDAYSAYSAKPGVFDGHKTVNKHGFISTPELEMKKANGNIRIVFLGESSTAGTGVNIEDEATWPWKCIEKLRKQLGKNVKIDFINAALGGYTSFDSYGRLWSHIRFFNPDIVIMNHGWNEMYYFGNADTASRWRSNFDLYAPITFVRIKPHWIDPYIKWSQLLSKIRFNWASTKREGERPTKEHTNLKSNFDTAGLTIFRDNLRLIQSFCAERNIALFVCKQATLIHAQTSEADKKRCRYEFHGFNHQAHLRAFEGLYRVIEQQANNKSIIDFTSLSGKSDCFYDHIHPSELGSEKLADIVKDSLLSQYFRNNLKLNLN